MFMLVEKSHLLTKTRKVEKEKEEKIVKGEVKEVKKLRNKTKRVKKIKREKSNKKSGTHYKKENISHLKTCKRPANSSKSCQ